MQNIDYNAKAQREKILYGNNTVTRYTYDEKTYRLTRLLTTRNSGADIMQDLNYSFDPIGNITQITDNAQQTIFFNNAGVDPVSKYEYDAIYRLTRSLGREHAGNNAASDQFDSDKTNDGSNRLTLKSDMNAMQNFEQKYLYDEVGNMLMMIHNAGKGLFSNKWTKNFQYNANNNQLIKTQVGPDTTNYSYDVHGNMMNLQNGGFNLIWDYADQLQQVALGGGGTAYYVYDGSGQRVRKVIENGTLINERIYLSAYERYREISGSIVQLERETLHILDDKSRIALIETRTKGTDNGLPFLVRYQYGNHLGTASLELNDNADIISYEEYYPFGSTSFQAMDNQTETPKRYRYTGKERDEESGLYYHGARYYAPWLVRWTACDPIGIKDGVNIYIYVNNSPIIKMDDTGNFGLTDIINGTREKASLASQKTKEFAERVIKPILQGGADATAVIEKNTVDMIKSSVMLSPPLLPMTLAQKGADVYKKTQTSEGRQELKNDIKTSLKSGPVEALVAMKKSYNKGESKDIIVAEGANAYLQNMPFFTEAGNQMIKTDADLKRGDLRSATKNAIIGVNSYAKDVANVTLLAEGVTEGGAKPSNIETNLPKDPATLIGTDTASFRNKAESAIRNTPNHPLKFLLDENGKFKPTRGLKHSELADKPDLVQMGHITSKKAGQAERVVLQDAYGNQFSNVTVETPSKGSHMENVAVDIGGIGVELETAKLWVKARLLSPEILANAKRVQ